MFLLSETTNLEQTNQIELVTDTDSNRVKDLIINKTTTFTLYDNLLALRDTDKKLELKGDLLKTITNRNQNADPAKKSDENLLFE